MSLQFLFLEDNSPDAEMVEAILLEAGIACDLQRVDTPSSFVTALQTNKYDLILADYALPNFDGITALEIAQNLCPNVPFIFVSASLEEELAIGTLKRGATDYVLKQRLGRLVPCVQRALREAQEKRKLKQTEIALQQNEARFQAVAANLPNGAIFLLDHKFRYQLAEGQAITNAGMTSEDLVGKTLWEALEPDLANQYETYYRQAFNGKPFSLEHYSHGRYYLSHGTPLYNEHNQVYAVLAISYDITDRKRAEEALKASEEKSRNILESIHDGFIALDENWQFTYVNQFAETLFDRPASSLIGKNFWEEFPEQCGTEFEQMYRRVMRDRVPASLTAFYPDHHRWYEGHSYPAANGITIYFRNVTDQVQAGAALRQSEERYRTLFESIDEGFCIIEVLFDENNTPIDYRFLEVNPAFEAQTGLQQAVGKTVRQLVPDFEDHWINISGQVALTGEAIRLEHGYKALNRWFDIYACRIGSPEGRKVAVVFKDISERKRIEAEREQLLQREQSAREAAETANRIKDEFLAVLSHKLRSPLNPILGWARLLKNGKFDAARQAEALATIERNAKLQTQLIEDLLDLSRIMQGKLSLKVAPTNVTTAISAAVETVSLAAEAKQIQVTLDLDAAAATVLGDAARLQQVVWNLLTNAVKFTSSGGKVTVELRQLEQMAQIRVIDTGKGIKPQFLPHVFEYFRQEDGSTTRKFGGLGLGLAIARQIVEMHGGWISVESPGEGQGATFTVELPLAPRLIQMPASEPASESTVNLDGIQVLVVDDEVDARDLVVFVLEQAGATATSVASGVEALQVVEQTVPDLIVSDIGMPEMDGYKLLQNIRVMEPARQVPAIALTAYAGEADYQQAMAAGFQLHVSKPVEPDMLVQAVACLCGWNSKKGGS